MDPIEQRLRNEVIYLHDLWHQGPPPPPSRHHHFTPPETHILPPFLIPPQPQFQHYPIQGPIFINSTSTSPSFRQPLLRVSNPTPFKRNSRNGWWKNKKKQDGSFNAERDGIPSDSGKEWPFNEYSSLDSRKWPESDPKRGSSAQPISEEELARHSNLRMQYRVIDELHGVFVKEEDGGGGGGGDDEEEEEEERNNDGGGGGLEESEEYKVLLDVFVKDSVLREYYEKNYENGDFCCFVCGVFGIKKSGKKYKSCLGLLQHTISIMKTTKRRTHRAFGMVICKVMGWDFGRLPTVIVKGEPLGRSLENSNVVRCDEQQNADGMKEDLKEVEKETIEVGNVESVEGRIVVEDDDHRADVVVLQSRVNEGDACTCSGDIDEGDTSMGIDNNGASNGIELDNNVGLQILLDSNGTSSNFDKLKEQTADENGAKISPVHGIELPCQNINDACSLDGWLTLKSPENSSVHVMSAEGKGNFEAYKLQKRVLEACQYYFQFKSGEEDGDNKDVKMEDSDDDDGEGSEDDIVEGSNSEECEEFKFFMRIFLENAELKSYYENSDEDGYFCCLVCGGIGKKTWKRFKGYTGLLQHSLTITKTRKQAHRALGRAMCKVFGWDINQFTKYTTNLTIPPGCSVKSTDVEGEPKHVADGSTGLELLRLIPGKGSVSLINVSNEITPFK